MAVVIIITATLSLEDVIVLCQWIFMYLDAHPQLVRAFLKSHSSRSAAVRRAATSKKDSTRSNHKDVVPQMILSWLFALLLWNIS